MRTAAEIASDLSHARDVEMVARRRREALERELTDLNSREFIRVNRITADDVQDDRGDGMPWFGDVYSFGKWMKEEGCSKRFYTWNGRLGFTSDIVAGRFIATEALAEHVPAGKEGA